MEMSGIPSIQAMDRLEPPLPTVIKSRNMLKQRSRKLIEKSQQALVNTGPIISQAKEIAARFNLKVGSSILDASYQSNFLPTKFMHGGNGDDMASNNTDSNNNADSKDPKNNSSLLLLSATPTVLRTTGGHSNTDHIIQCTGNSTFDKIAEYKRALQRRAKAVQPEHRGKDRWDLPRLAGVRRRRIMREKDLPKAPPEPPTSGYVVFIAQMTTKIRHERPNKRHDQISVVKQISKMWKYGLSAKDRAYYNTYAREAREEYERQHTEFRATGTYTVSSTFERINGDGPWVRSVHDEKNALEREIATYDRVKFPPRPDNVEVPFWVTRGKGERERGMRNREIMKEKRRKEEEEKWEQLELVRIAKAKRLKMVNFEGEEEEV